MTTKLFLTLNNYFPNDATINDLSKYLSKGDYPASVNTYYKRNRYREKFKYFIIKNEKIFYEPPPSTGIPKLEVIREKDKDKILNQLYKDPLVGVGKGIRAFYKYVTTKYINIKRDDVAKFLKGQSIFQMTRPMTHRTNKPIVATYPNQLYCIDLIDMNDVFASNRPYRYIFTCVDVFSRKVWLEALTNKSAIDNREAMKRIVARTGVTCRATISDNGAEFRGEFEQWCKEEGIKQRRTQSYSPEQNGIVENMNKQVRKRLAEMATRQKTRRWVDNLRAVEQNKNDTYSRILKGSPNQIWSPTRNRPTGREIPDGNPYSNASVLAYHKKQTRDKIKKFRQTEFDEGDLVRIKFPALFSNARKLVKEGNQKLILVQYSPLVFRIVHVIKPKDLTLERQRYIVTTLEGSRLRVKKGFKNFYASDMIKVGDKSTNISNLETHMTMDEALKINQIERTANDVFYDTADFYEPNYFQEEPEDPVVDYWNEADDQPPARYNLRQR
jgi:transposase InsO family protein